MYAGINETIRIENRSKMFNNNMYIYIHELASYIFYNIAALTRAFSMYKTYDVGIITSLQACIVMVYTVRTYQVEKTDLNCL